MSRREARVAAMRVLYAAISSGGEKGEEARQRFIHMSESARESLALADDLAENIIRVFDLRRDDIEKSLAEVYGKAIMGITMVERAVIVAAAAEMLGHPDTPAAVVINEAIEISKEFGTEGGHQLVNGLLEKMGERIEKD